MWGGVALLGIQVQGQLGLVHSPQIKTFRRKPLLKRKKENYLFILVGLGGGRRLSMGHNFCALAVAASLLPWSFTRQEVHTRLVLGLFFFLSLLPRPNANAKKASKQNTHTHTHTHTEEKLFLCKPLHLAALQLPNRSLNFSALCTYLPRV